MAQILTIKNGVALMVYDDRWRPLLEALGTLKVERATSIEFEEISAEWVGTHIATGQVIARGRNRDQVIADEVAWLETNVIGR